MEAIDLRTTSGIKLFINSFNIEKEEKEEKENN